MISLTDRANFNRVARKQRTSLALRSGGILAAALIVVLYANTGKYTAVQTAKIELDLVTSRLKKTQPIGGPNSRAATTITISENQPSSELLSWFNDSAIAAGCRLTGLEPIKLEEPSTLPLSSWRMDVSGSYHCLGRLTENLEQSSNIVEVLSVDISVPRKSETLAGQVKLNVWTVE